MVGNLTTTAWLSTGENACLRVHILAHTHVHAHLHAAMLHAGCCGSSSIVKSQEYCGTSDTCDGQYVCHRHSLDKETHEKFLVDLFIGCDLPSFVEGVLPSSWVQKVCLF